jgi:hypothetical protein
MLIRALHSHENQFAEPTEDTPPVWVDGALICRDVKLC